MTDIDKQRIAAPPDLNGLITSTRQAITDAFHIPADLLVERRPRTTAEEVRDAMVKAQAQQYDREIRWLLGQWVSELEPSLVMWNGRIHGLAWVGDPGRIVVYNGIDPRPLLKKVFELCGFPDPAGFAIA
jgi:hypothetical protein